MSLSSISPIVKCKYPGCGRYVTIQIETFVSDPDGQIMQLSMKTAMENALCDFHRRQRAWYSQQGRLEDWEAGRP